MVVQPAPPPTPGPGGAAGPGGFDPNQPALPGLEGAPHERVLARGLRFDVRWAGGEEDHFLGVVRGGELASGMFVHARADALGARGEVRTVFTDDRFRRQGLATALWDVAARLGMEPRHAGNRTDDGDGWARRVGGDLPPRRRGRADRPMVPA